MPRSRQERKPPSRSATSRPASTAGCATRRRPQQLRGSQAPEPCASGWRTTPAGPSLRQPRAPGSTRSRALGQVDRRRLKRGTFRSVVSLQQAINRFIEHQPFHLESRPQHIIDAAKRGHQPLETIHETARNRTDDRQIGQGGAQISVQIGQRPAGRAGYGGFPRTPAAFGGWRAAGDRCWEAAFRIKSVHAWRELSGWRRGARPEAGGSDRAVAGGSARKALTAAARDGINLRRCNNGKEVIPCLTLRWRVAQVRRSRLRSRPSGSADAAENINSNTIRVTTWTCLVRRCPQGGGGVFSWGGHRRAGARGSTLPRARRSGIVARRSRRRDQAWPRSTAS